ncbi:MAG: hypothetical protein KDA84_29620 [Planctomycetaceae bacterium]|nr:hypothetical protein [Planctomycetaceae bacterium]
MDTALVRQARELKGVEIVQDVEGVIAAEFGVVTSGHVLFYDATDRLRFSGGITALRNHEGWNAGCASLIALGKGTAAPIAETPVFGCTIAERSCECCKGSCEVQP